MKPQILLALPLAFAAVLAFPNYKEREAVRRAAREPELLRVSYWEKWTDFEGAAMQAVVERFNAKGFRNARGQRIAVELLTVSQIDQKTLLAVSGANPPDVAGLWSGNIHVFAEKNALIPLDEYLARCGIGEADYLPAYFRLCRHRDRIWALPTTPATVALHWNKAHFREAGLDPERPPRTIQELDEYALRLNTFDARGRPLRMGFLPTEPGWWGSLWGLWFGGKLVDETGSRITAASEENIRAFRWVRSYSQRYGAEVLTGFRNEFGNFNSPQNAFLAGRVSMQIQGIWMYNFIQRYSPAMEWGAAAFPSGVPGLSNVTIAEADVLCIPRGARHPEEAFQFIRFVNTQEGMELLCLGQRKHTPLRSVSPEFAHAHPHPYLQVFRELAESENASCTPRLGLWAEYNTEMSWAFDVIWRGTLRPEEALRRVQEKMQGRCDLERERAAARERPARRWWIFPGQPVSE